MGLLDQWNKNKFSIYKNEEKTVLKLLESISKWLEKIIIGLDGKTDLFGDHKGSWQGIEKPTLAEEGLATIVEDISNVVYNKIDIVENFNINVESKKTMEKNYLSQINTNKTNNIFTISTFNILAFHNIKSIPIKKALYEIYKTNSNVCCIQEMTKSINWNSEKLLKTNEFTNTYFSKILLNDKGEYGLCTIANENFLSQNSNIYTMDTSYEQRGYQKVEINFNGKRISIYNTHLSYENDDILKSQINQLNLVLASDTNSYKIVCGDFNTENLTYLSMLGMKISNNGEYKTFKSGMKAIDNILVSNNINIISKKMSYISNEISDHNIFTVELEVI